MIPNDYKTSLLVAQQLPEFVRDNESYQTFVSFIEAYYQWLETAQTANSANVIATSTGEGVTYGAKNILNYADVDATLDEFVQYFIKDFLPYIPEDALADKRKLLKIARDFYLAKGTEKSYKFLFRALYNSDAEVFNTADVVLRASDGKWIISKSLRINSADPNLLLINNLKLQYTMSTITSSGGTIGILYDAGTFSYQIDSGSFTTISSWPVTINNISSSSTLTVNFLSNATFSSTSDYFICGSNNIIFDGGSKTMYIVAGINYLGLIQNGTSISSGYNDIICENLIINNGGSTLITGGGWLGQSYFGRGATGCEITNCNSNQYCLISSGSGGILGSYSGTERANLLWGTTQMSVLSDFNVSGISILNNTTSSFVGNNTNIARSDESTAAHQSFLFFLVAFTMHAWSSLTGLSGFLRIRLDSTL
jgi:hypothetical protein